MLEKADVLFLKVLRELSYLIIKVFVSTELHFSFKTWGFRKIFFQIRFRVGYLCYKKVLFLSILADIINKFKINLQNLLSHSLSVWHSYLL